MVVTAAALAFPGFDDGVSAGEDSKDEEVDESSEVIEDVPFSG